MTLETRRRHPLVDARVLAMMGLFFLVVCAVGILRPIKNSLALDGLGARDFYKVYLVSAAVVVFVPLFTRAADRLPWRWLIPGLALFFASHLVLFRLFYVEGSAAFGVAFYGWYDLFAASLVAQFFMTAQIFFDARAAKQAYPIVIAGGSIGATFGSAITGFFAESVGTPNLLLVAAVMIVLFSVSMPLAWRGIEVQPPARREREQLVLGELRRVFADPHVRLIAGAVLLTIVVKQLVDFQYNALTREVFVDRDAMSAFQGKFNAATQWLPLVVLAGLRPALRRWGVGVAVLLMPVAMLITGVGLALAFGLAAAVAAKGADAALRYSAERAGREILYVPVPDEIKLKAKAYIDVAVEKGLGKALSAAVLAGLLVLIPYQRLGWVTAALAAAWVVLAVTVQREYMRTLARAIEGRFASLRGVAVALWDASSRPALRRALAGSSPVQAAFVLELLDQAPAPDVRPYAPELNALAARPDAELSTAALRQLARIAEDADEAVVRGRLDAPEPAVVDAALRVLIARPGVDDDALLRDLLASDRPGLRLAALRHLVQEGRLTRMRLVGRQYIESRWNAAAGDADARVELALAAGGLGDDPAAERYLEPFVDDPDPRVRGVALRSAGLLGRADLAPAMIRALGEHATREHARAALVQLGDAAVQPLADALMSDATPPRVRRAIPGVLGELPDPRVVQVLLELVLAPETEQMLDYRCIKALGKLRSRNPDLPFESPLAWTVTTREADAALDYAIALRALPGAGARAEVRELLEGALRDGWRERRESVFRLLGLFLPQAGIYRAYVGTTSGGRQRRANGLEWLEQTLGHARYRALAPVLEAAEPDQAVLPPRPPTDLSDNDDAWIARLWRACTAPAASCPEEIMELVEKVLLLQRVDLLRGARGAQLALLASIADDVAAEAGDVLVQEGEPATAMYVVTRGRVGLHGVGGEVELGAEEAFGTWALIDDSPSPLEARALEPTRLLCITRADFHDLLSDHPELSVALLQGLARRMRSLVA